MPLRDEISRRDLLGAAEGARRLGEGRLMGDERANGRKEKQERKQERKLDHPDHGSDLVPTDGYVASVSLFLADP
jgi:hypothetical protein